VGWAGAQIAAGEAFEVSLVGVVEGEWGCHVVCCWFVSCWLIGGFDEREYPVLPFGVAFDRREDVGGSVGSSAVMWSSDGGSPLLHASFTMASLGLCSLVSWE
jgi:hypothetical protein